VSKVRGEQNGFYVDLIKGPPKIPSKTRQEFPKTSTSEVFGSFKNEARGRELVMEERKEI
jgi:hypothetical protein